MWRIILIQAFMGVLVTCKTEEDPFKNEGARISAPARIRQGQGAEALNRALYAVSQKLGFTGGGGGRG